MASDNAEDNEATQADIAKYGELHAKWGQQSLLVSAMLDEGMEAGDEVDELIGTGKELLDLFPKLLQAAYGKTAEGSDAPAS